MMRKLILLLTFFVFGVHTAHAGPPPAPGEFKGYVISVSSSEDAGEDGSSVVEGVVELVFTPDEALWNVSIVVRRLLGYKPATLSIKAYDFLEAGVPVVVYRGLERTAYNGGKFPSRLVYALWVSPFPGAEEDSRSWREKNAIVELAAGSASGGEPE